MRMNEHQTSAQLLKAAAEAMHREAREAAESAVWAAVADKVATADMRAAWDTLASCLVSDAEAVVAALGLTQWAINSGRIEAQHSVGELDAHLAASCCIQMDADCIGLRMGDAHGTLWLQAPSACQAEGATA
jgi:hypothetical protein